MKKCSYLTNRDLLEGIQSQRHSKRIFVRFSFLGTLTRRKNAVFRHFVRFCGVFWAAKNHYTKGATKAAQKAAQKVAQEGGKKTPQYQTKCRVCGVFATCKSKKTFKNAKKSVFLRLPFVGVTPLSH